MSTEPWRDEIQEYALLIDAIASGDRSRSLKLLASYVLAKDNHADTTEQEQPSDTEGQESEEYPYQDGEGLTGQDFYGGEAEFGNEEPSQQNGNGHEYAFDPDEYAEYDGGEYQPEYDGAYMSGGIAEGSEQNNATAEDEYHYGDPYDGSIGASEHAHHNSYDDEGTSGHSHQNDHQTWSNEPGGEWHQNLESTPGMADQLRDNSFDTYGDFPQIDHGATVWKRRRQRGLENENRTSYTNDWDAEGGGNGGTMHFEPDSRISFDPGWSNILDEHSRKDGDSWNQGDFTGDSGDWEDASVEDEDQ